MAKRYLAEEGAALVFSPDFTLVEISGKECTAVRLSISTTENGAPTNGEV